MWVLSCVVCYFVCNMWTCGDFAPIVAESPTHMVLFIMPLWEGTDICYLPYMRHVWSELSFPRFTAPLAPTHTYSPTPPPQHVLLLQFSHATDLVPISTPTPTFFLHGDSVLPFLLSFAHTHTHHARMALLISAHAAFLTPLPLHAAASHTCFGSMLGGTFAALGCICLVNRQVW